MIRLVNRKIKKQWYMRRNEREGDPKGEKKHLRSDRSARETTFKKHLNHPFTVMQPFVLQHTCTRTHTHKRKKGSGRSYGNYYYDSFEEKHSELTKASTSILKLSKKGWGFGGVCEDFPQVIWLSKLHCGLSYGWSEATTQGSNIQKTVSNLWTEVDNYFTIWLFVSSFKSWEHSLKCLLFRSLGVYLKKKSCLVKHEITEEMV